MSSFQSRSFENTLPVEVLRLIFDAVGDHVAGAYKYEKGTLRTLTSVSRTSKTFHHIAADTLYRRVYITPSNLAAFNSTLETLVPAPTVRFLAFAEFGVFSDDEFVPEELSMIMDIMENLPDKVTHLLFDLPLRSLYHNEAGVQFLDAATSFTQVEELISCRDEVSLTGWLSPPCLWPEWEKLRRLALFNINLDETELWEALAAHPQLGHFLAGNPRGPHNFLGTQVKDYVDMTPDRLRLTFIDAEDSLPYSPDSVDDYFEFAKSSNVDPQILKEVVTRGGRFRIVDAESLESPELQRDPKDYQHTWFRKVATAGHIWTLADHFVPPEVCQYRLDHPEETAVSQVSAALGWDSDDRSSSEFHDPDLEEEASDILEEEA